MKVLIFLLFCLPFSSFAATTLEEGIILQDELRFLEETTQQNFQQASLETPSNSSNSDELDLESTYFNNNGSNQDEVNVRAGAPRRRR